MWPNCSGADLPLSDTKARAACTHTVGPATFWTSFVGRNTKVSKQKIHALLHSSHSTGDKLKFPAHRHDTALRTRRGMRAVLSPRVSSVATWCQTEPLHPHLRVSRSWSPSTDSESTCPQQVETELPAERGVPGGPKPLSPHFPRTGLRDSAGDRGGGGHGAEHW